MQPTTYGVAESDVKPSSAWTRVVLDGDEVVGMIIGTIRPGQLGGGAAQCHLRVNVAASAQGRGVGRFAVHGLADEARSRGLERLTVVYEPGGDDSPEAFFRAVGFEVVRETQYGDHFAVLDALTVSEGTADDAGGHDGAAGGGTADDFGAAVAEVVRLIPPDT